MTIADLHHQPPCLGLWLLGFQPPYGTVLIVPLDDLPDWLPGWCMDHLGSGPCDVLFQAHSSLLDLIFYQADQFPAEFKGDMFVALKGSWNRSQPTGYKVVRVPFKDGKPQGYYENFAAGFWTSGEERAEVWGRPAALAVAKDGSLLVADDTGGTIWRISYAGTH